MVAPAKVVEDFKKTSTKQEDILEVIKKHCLIQRPVSA